MKSFLKSLRGGRLLVVILVLVALLIALGRLASGVVTEILWQTEAGYLGVFWRRVLWQWGARVLAGAAVGLMVYFDLRAVAGTLGGIQIKRRFGEHRDFRAASARLRVRSHGGNRRPAGAVVRSCRARVRGRAGAAVDPRHDLGCAGADPGQGRGLLRVLASHAPQPGGVRTGGGLPALHPGDRRVRRDGRRAVGEPGSGLAEGGPRASRGVAHRVFLVLLAVHLWFGRYVLLLSGSSHVQGIFGYADAQARLPALQTMVVLTLAAAAAVFWGSWRNRGVLVS